MTPKCRVHLQPWGILLHFNIVVQSWCVSCWDSASESPGDFLWSFSQEIFSSLSQSPSGGAAAVAAGRLLEGVSPFRVLFCKGWDGSRTSLEVDLGWAAFCPHQLILSLSLPSYSKQVNVYNFLIHLNLNYQLNIDCYNYNMYYESLLVMTNQKPITDTKMIKRKNQNQHNKNKFSKTAREEERNYKEIRKQWTKWK